MYAAYDIYADMLTKRCNIDFSKLIKDIAHIYIHDTTLTLLPKSNLSKWSRKNVTVKRFERTIYFVNLFKARQI